jgi:serine/threonine protein phosphatase 1
MKYFVSSDVHGFYDEWIVALNEKGFDITNPLHKIIFCGDAFDRGNQPVEVYKFLKDLKEHDKLIFIRGNHEDLLFDCVKDLKEFDGCAHFHHYLNGTIDTVKQLSNANLLEEVLEFINKNSLDYYETSHYIFVHGWIPIIENCYLYDENWRNARKERFEKSRWINSLDMYKYQIYEPNKKIVCGHYHCSAFWHELNPKEFDEFGDKENFEPFINDKMIALDTCTVHTRRVNCLIIDD